MGSNQPISSAASVDDESGTGSIQSNTKYGEWKDTSDCDCSASRHKILEMRIVRTPLLSTASDLSLGAIRLTANFVSIGYAEKWLGTNNIPLEHQAIECDVFCVDCLRLSQYTFEYLGGIGKLSRNGLYTKKYSTHCKRRAIRYTELYLSDVYDIYHTIPGRWKAHHYDAVTNNCQQFAHLFWSQLFGLEEDDHGEWQPQTQYKCKCSSDSVSVRKVKLIRVQKSSDAKEISSSVIHSTLNILSMGAVDTQKLRNENNLVLHAIELFCKCNDCATECFYTLENSPRGKYFRCGFYGKQLKSLRQIRKRKSLNLKKVHVAYKNFSVYNKNTDNQVDNKKWTCSFWERLFHQSDDDNYVADY